MKILVIADIEDLHWQYGTGHAEILLSCGDVCDQVILEAAAAYGAESTLAVKGNHDGQAPFAAPIVDLHLRTCVINGVRFGGLNGSWKYKPRGHFLYEQRDVSAFLSSFPPVNVFLSHNSPKGVHDRNDGVHVGFEALNAYIGKAKPILLLHGHQHVRRQTVIGQTTVMGIHGHEVIDIPARK